MTEQLDGSHQPWDELVAAHALHALEPTEELRLLAHLDGCSPCRKRLDEFVLVAAQLGSLADDTLDPPAWTDVQPHILSAGTPAASGRVFPLLPLQRRVAVRALAAAAAVVVVAAGVATSWELTRPGPTTSAAALTACRQQSDCRIVALHGQQGDSAAVLVEAGHVSVVPTRLPLPPAGRMYVLWQLPRDGSPIPVVTFHDPTRQTSSVPLVTGYTDTAAFAVSLENAGPMPTHPTDVLAVGAAGS